MTEHNGQIGKKAYFYKNENTEIYIKLENGFFYRGFIIDIGSDFLILDDQKLGKMPVFYSEIVAIEPRSEKE